jgi:uncharacterized membrane protein YuzA (DUF378 family)
VSTLQLSALDWVCFGLLIVGALNWGLVGIAQINAVRTILDPVFQSTAAETLARILYVLIGMAGVYFFYPLYRVSQQRRSR